MHPNHLFAAPRLTALLAMVRAPLPPVRLLRWVFCSLLALLVLAGSALAQNISTVAGTGVVGYNGDGVQATAAQLNAPAGVAMDAAGNLYIADTTNHRIRKVDAGTGSISTVAGDGTFGYSGDGGQATVAQLWGPYGVALDAAGNLYIADHVNNRIRKVDGAGVISTVAGNGMGGFQGDGGQATAARLNSPWGIALDAAGNLYIADFNNSRIRKVDAVTGHISTAAGSATTAFSGDNGPATAAALNNPIGVVVDAAGNLFFSDHTNNRVRKVDGAGVISTVAGDGTQGFGGDGGPATAAHLNGPRGVALDAAGNLYIADSVNQRIRKVDAATGVISTVAGNGTQGFGGDGGPATAALLNYPNGLVLDAAADLYIADADGHRIRKVAPAPPDAPTAVTAVAGNAQASVSWTAPTGNGGRPITGYTVRAVQDNTKTCTPTPATATTCTVTGLGHGTGYTFTVVASNSVGAGAASAASAMVTTAAPPDPGPSHLPITTPGAATPITDPALPIVIGAEAAGGTLVLPGTGTVPVQLQVTINGQPLQVQALPGSHLRIAQVPGQGQGQGQSALVVVVVQGWASMTSSAVGQPMALAGQVLLSAGHANTTIEAQPLTVAVLMGSLVPSQGSGANGTGTRATTLPQVGSMGLQAGEKLQVNAQGAVVSITLGSLLGDAGLVGDGMNFFNLPSAISVDGKQFARLNGPLARLSGANLAQGLESTASGIYLLRDGGQVFQLLPTVPITVDATLPDGLTFTPLGLLRWVRGGVVVQFAPAVADLAGLASAITALLPDAQIKLGAEGVIQLRTGGRTYVLKPGWTGAGTAAGTPQIGVDSEGRIYFQLGTGAKQLLLPALLHATQANAIFQAALPGATLAVQAASNEGAFTVTLVGQTWRLVPQWVLPEGNAAQVPTPGANWWTGSDGTLYLKLGSQVQGVRVAP